jgi:type II secretory pathway pseudopilin PulG
MRDGLKKPRRTGRKRFPMPGRSPSSRGFTVVELLGVLLVLSLCAATCVRWYFAHSDVTLENAAILLARDLRAAQHRSIFLGEPSRFVFLPDGAGYAVTDALGALTHNPTTDEPFVRSYPDDGVFVGVRVLTFDVGADHTLDIDGRGLPLEDLSVTLGFEGEERTVQLDHESGEITVVGSSSGYVDRDL